MDVPDDVAGDWWQLDLPQVDRSMKNGSLDFYASGSTINGKLGDLFNCSGKQITEDACLCRRHVALFFLYK